jgi:Glycosyl hydrolases family 16
VLLSQIMEARGNGPSYPAQGVNFVRSTLSWGPLPSLTSRLLGWQSLKRSTYAQGFHTYTLEWTEKFIKIYVDSRLKNMVQLQIDGKQQSNGGFFWKRGNFPLTAHNNTADEIVVPNPWTTATVENATNAAPFDQRASQRRHPRTLACLTHYSFSAFYLILDLAVGGTSGWFPDNMGNKPWFDESASAMRDFASQQSSWSATWPQDDDDVSFRMYVVWCAILLSPSLNKSAVTLYAFGISVEVWPIDRTSSNNRQDNLARLVRDMDALDILIYSSFLSTLLARSFPVCLHLHSVAFTTLVFLNHICQGLLVVVIPRSITVLVTL